MVSNVVGRLASSSHDHLIKAKMRLQGKSPDDKKQLRDAMKSHKSHVSAVPNLIEKIELLKKKAEK